jgi:hypothetical protein
LFPSTLVASGTLNADADGRWAFFAPLLPSWGPAATGTYSAAKDFGWNGSTLNWGLFSKVESSYPDTCTTATAYPQYAVLNNASTDFRVVSSHLSLVNATVFTSKQGTMYMGYIPDVSCASSAPQAGDNNYYRLQSLVDVPDTESLFQIAPYLKQYPGSFTKETASWNPHGPNCRLFKDMDTDPVLKWQVDANYANHRRNEGHNEARLVDGVAFAAGIGFPASAATSITWKLIIHIEAIPKPHASAVLGAKLHSGPGMYVPHTGSAAPQFLDFSWNVGNSGGRARQGGNGTVTAPGASVPAGTTVLSSRGKRAGHL